MRWLGWSFCAAEGRSGESAVMKIECPHCKKDVTLDWATAVQWMTRWIGPIVGTVALALFFPLIIFVEQAVLLYEAWSYRRAAKNGTLGPGDGIWSGRLNGLFIQDFWGSFGGLAVFIVECAVLGILVETWIVLFIFFLFWILFLVMSFITFVLNTKPIPPPSVPSHSEQ